MDRRRSERFPRATTAAATRIARISWGTAVTRGRTPPLRSMCCVRNGPLRGDVTRPAPMLRRDPEQLDQVPAEDLLLLRVVQETSVENKVDTNGPVKGIVGSIEDVVDTDL